MKRLAASLSLLSCLCLATLALAQTGQPTPGSSAQMANPASVFCAQCGGTVQIVPTPQGETGWCLFPGGQAIEEWSLWRLFNAPAVPAQ